jgi:signal transduction histidine kinase
LEHGIIRYTTLHYKAKNLEIPINAESNEVFSRAFRTGKTLQVNSADDQETINTEFYRLFEPNHFVLAPLIVNNDVVGMLVVDNKFTGEPIRPMELELLESCASQAAAAIYRSNLHHQVEDRVHVMEHLQELAQAFSVLAEPREVLRRIVKATTELLRADITYLVPFDPDMKELLVEEAVTAGAETSFQHEGTFSSSGLTALAMNEPGGLVVIEDLEAREDLRSRFADQERIRSVAACRLELSKHIVGMLYINYQRNHRYSELELNTLRMLAGQAAVAIYNARLLMQIEKLATQRERSRLREDLHGVLNTFAFKVMEPAESIFEKEKSKRRKDQKLVEEADELWRFSRHTYKQLELILEDMRDPVLVERGLPEALRLLVTSSKLPGVRLSIAGETRPSAEVELALYRICQEAVSNIRKHACLPEQGENLVKIQLELGDEQSCLLIQDQGRGFSSQIINDRRKGMGLQAMTNWARNVGAQIDIQSIPGKGTRIVVVVPKTKNKEFV